MSKCAYFTAVLVCLLAGPVWAASDEDLTQKAKELHGAGKLKEAVEIYDKILTQRFEDPAVWYAKAYALMQLGDIPKAKKAFGVTVMLEPGDLRARLFHGWMGLYSEEYEEALTDFRHVLSAVPNEIRAVTGQGYCEMAMGRTFSARETFQKALELDPKNKEINDLVLDLRDHNYGILRAEREAKIARFMRAMLKQQAEEFYEEQERKREVQRKWTKQMWEFEKAKAVAREGAPQVNINIRGRRYINVNPWSSW